MVGNTIKPGATTASIKGARFVSGSQGKPSMIIGNQFPGLGAPVMQAVNNATITPLKPADINYNQPGGAPIHPKPKWKKYLPIIIIGGVLFIGGVIALLWPKKAKR